MIQAILPDHQTTVQASQLVGRFFRRLILLMLFVSDPAPALSQVSEQPAGGWHLESSNGLVSIEAQRRSQENIIVDGRREYADLSFLTARLLLNTRSYIWHPNFMSLDVDLDLNPGVRQDNYLVAPDRSESMTAERLRIQSTFFRNRPLSFSAFAHLNNNFVYRELSSNVETSQLLFGNTLDYRNPRMATVRARHSWTKWEQVETQTGRLFLDTRYNLSVEAKKKMGKYGTHRVNYTFEDLTREFDSVSRFRTKISEFFLNNDFVFESTRQSTLNSLIWSHRQAGLVDFNRFQVREDLRVRLPKNFRTTGLYQYIKSDRSDLSSVQHRAMGTLEHRLFESLRSEVFYEYVTTKQTTFGETRRQVGLDLEYRKKIPTGLVVFTYNYSIRGESKVGIANIIRTVDEELVLDDDEFVLLKHPFADPGSVVVTDDAQTIVYQEDVDYYLITRGDFLELRRIPGSQIDNGATVIVDYSATPQSYTFDAVSQTAEVRLTLLKNLVQVYYRASEVDFENLEGTDLKILRTVSQRVFGFQIWMRWLSVGAERDLFESNIVPYRSARAFARFATALGRRWNVSMTGNVRDVIFSDADERQQFVNIAGRMAYRLGRSTILNVESTYRFQEGRGIDLDLKTLGAEIRTGRGRLQLVLGLQVYFRNFSGEEINFTRWHTRLVRTF